ncbi:S41 family peptidase [Asticcacaulis sp.]|uniref:S41 family peptidase n=1 Tax=Asticcacaulis sp. TaxID=1872648 RepID=UPI0031D330B9
MITRREALAFGSSVPFAGNLWKGIVWTPLDLIGEDAHGAWESEATGHVVDVSSAGLRVFHRLDDTWFQDSGLTPAFSLFARTADTLLLQHYDYRQTPFLMQTPARLTRSTRPLRAALTQADVVAPSAVFDLICRSFDHYYAFFAERGVDWTATRREAAPRLVENNGAVFDLLAGMLAPLDDGHVNLSRGERQFNAGRPKLRETLKHAWRAGASVETESAFVARWSRESRASMIATLDPGSARSGANGALEWGRLGDVGYLRVNRFSGFLAGQATRQQQVAALQSTLAEAEGAFSGTRCVIVDVAHNGGGNDAAAMVVARHFADQPRRVLTYSTRGMPDQPIELAPAGTAYPRPVVLVASEITASAAEVFVMMMRAFPHVTQVGGRTRGMLSSLLPKPFPNGFMATMVYQRVLDCTGLAYEARGLPPAREIDLFPAADLWTGYAKAVRDLAVAGAEA